MSLNTPAADEAIVQTIRSAAALTSSYVASTAFKIKPSAVGFDLELTIVKDTITSIEYDLQATSDGGTTWFTTTSEQVAAGLSTVSKVSATIAVSGFAATEGIIIAFDRPAYQHLRFRFKETGTAGSNTLKAVIRQVFAS